MFQRPDASPPLKSASVLSNALSVHEIDPLNDHVRYPVLRCEPRLRRERIDPRADQFHGREFFFRRTPLHQIFRGVLAMLQRIAIAARCAAAVLDPQNRTNIFVKTLIYQQIASKVVFSKFHPPPSP